MLTKFVLVFSLVALVAATAGTIPVKGPARNITLSESATVSGTALKAGDYRVIVNTDKVTFLTGKESHEITAKVETDAKKYDETAVKYVHDGKLTTIKEICLGGTKTRIVFN